MRILPQIYNSARLGLAGIVLSGLVSCSKFSPPKEKEIPSPSYSRTGDIVQFDKTKTLEDAMDAYRKYQKAEYPEDNMDDNEYAIVPAMKRWSEDISKARIKIGDSINLKDEIPEMVMLYEGFTPSEIKEGIVRGQKIPGVFVKFRGNFYCFIDERFKEVIEDIQIQTFREFVTSEESTKKIEGTAIEGLYYLKLLKQGEKYRLPREINVDLSVLFKIKGNKKDTVSVFKVPNTNGIDPKTLEGMSIKIQSKKY